MQGRSGHVTPASSHHNQHPQCNPLPLYPIIKETWWRFPSSFTRHFTHNSFCNSLIFSLWRHLPMFTELPVVLARLCRKNPQGQSLSLWTAQWFRSVHGAKGVAKKGSAAGYCLDLMLPFFKESWEGGKRQKQLPNNSKRSSSNTFTSADAARA